MRLSRFINNHMDQILVEWDAFARSLGSTADAMSILALRDHAKGILQAIALDIESWQNAEQQLEKSQGLLPDVAEKQSAASIHGALRQASNFSLLQLSAEYRALRATVLRLWLPQVTQMSTTTTSEMVRFNEAIDQALAESITTYSARAEQSRDLLLAILGHDLRAPLSSINLASELLLAVQGDHGKVSQIGARIKRSTRLMSSMVNDLLGYSQTQLGGSMPVTRHPADIKDICELAIEHANAAHPASKFSLETEGDLNGSFDGIRMHQLLTNLLSNAAQYGEKARPILMAVRGEADAITIEVTNYGSPIPEGSLNTIFTPLVQLERKDENDTRPKTSLGLGLFVAREIVVAHGGTIGVKSSEDEGTTFTVRLPR